MGMCVESKQDLKEVPAAAYLLNAECVLCGMYVEVK